MYEPDKKINKLVVRFVNAAQKHNEALKVGSSRNANIQARKINQIFLEICKIGPNAREALLEQIENADPAVAGMAAVYSLKYNTERSLEVLRKIAQQPGLIGFRAEHTIKNWEKGTWQIE